MFRNKRAMEIPKKTEPVMMKGRLLPRGFFVRSDQLPIRGSVTASHSTATALMTPAMAGGTPAWVVRKKEKKEKNTL